MPRSLRPILLLSLALCAGPVPDVPLGAAGLRPLYIRCTTAGIYLPTGFEKTAKHPIVAALEAAGPGTVIRVDAGTYGPFSIGLGRRAGNDAHTSGGLPNRPIVVQGTGRVRIRSDGGDTIAIHQQIPNGYITFRNLEIEGGRRAAIMFYRQPAGRVHAGYTFEDCHILGGWDHLRRRGNPTKWGLWAHSLKDFRFAGTVAPARVQNIRLEHGFYIQNPQGDITLERISAKHLGRTFCQFTARAKDGPPGKGTILVRNCDVTDVGISYEDGYKGGAAFTVAGRLRGDIIFEGNRYQAGFDPRVRALTRPGKPYGTGAFVAWDGGQQRNARLVLRNNEFRFAKGCGDRPVVAIGGCDNVEIVGVNVFRSGGQFDALAIDPVDASGKLISKPNGKVHVATTTRIEGRHTRKGVEVGGSPRKGGR